MLVCVRACVQYDPRVHAYVCARTLRRKTQNKSFCFYFGPQLNIFFSFWMRTRAHKYHRDNYNISMVHTNHRVNYNISMVCTYHRVKYFSMVRARTRTHKRTHAHTDTCERDVSIIILNFKKYNVFYNVKKCETFLFEAESATSQHRRTTASPVNLPNCRPKRPKQPE